MIVSVLLPLHGGGVDILCVCVCDGPKMKCRILLMLIKQLPPPLSARVDVCTAQLPYLKSQRHTHAHSRTQQPAYVLPSPHPASHTLACCRVLLTLISRDTKWLQQLQAPICISWHNYHDLHLGASSEQGLSPVPYGTGILLVPSVVIGAFFVVVVVTLAWPGRCNLIPTSQRFRAEIK